MEREQATAAYNFVPLGPMVVPAPLAGETEDDGRKWNELDPSEQQKRFAAYVRAEGKNSGWFDVTVEALTPLLVGGAENNGVFFAPDGRPRLPGSSLRGMTRNLVKILGCGAMRKGEDFADKRLYFRVIAAKSGDTRNEHYKELIHADATGKSGAKPGFLMRLQDGRYVICRASEEKQKPLHFGDQPDIHWNGHTAVAIGGPMKGKRAVYEITAEDWMDTYEVPDRLIQDYLADPRRIQKDWQKKEKAIDLLDETRNYSGDLFELTGRTDVRFVIPCHYILGNDGKVESFGHGSKYRLPYEQAISDHVPDPLTGAAESCPDLGDAIFGVAALWAGRVSFEDGILQGEPSFETASLTRPQLAPKPTAYQMYLKQPAQDGMAKHHWDSDKKKSPLRGYKFYWHQHTAWQHQDGKEKDPVISGATPVQPLKPGARFVARIHFQDLSDIELGALCAALGLGKQGNVAYKLGRGKALGMGSVRVKPSLHLMNEEGQYQSFFSEGRLAHVEKEAAWNDFVQAFKTYRTEQLGTRADAFDETEKDLLAVMDYGLAGDKGTPKASAWTAQVATMPIGNKQDKRFAHHIVLPDIRTVVNQAKQGHRK